MSKFSKLKDLANHPTVKKAIKDGKEKAVPLIKKEIEKRKSKKK
ncbi:hypothetical protein [Pseudalkalibacillus decolorationis]|nr:hypothetical protein [Pseudalkalibacillus decolorationis]